MHPGNGADLFMIVYQLRPCNRVLTSAADIDADDDLHEVHNNRSVLQFECLGVGNVSWI